MDARNLPMTVHTDGEGNIIRLTLGRDLTQPKANAPKSSQDTTFMQDTGIIDQEPKIGTEAIKSYELLDFVKQQLGIEIGFDSPEDKAALFAIIARTAIDGLKPEIDEIELNEARQILDDIGNSLALLKINHNSRLKPFTSKYL